MSSVKCPSCGSDNIVFDSARGEYTCSCGRVLQENVAVSELAFTDSNVFGKFVSQSGDYGQIKCLLGYSKNAKELRRQKVYKQIQQLASQLNLTQYHIEAAKRLFNMAQERNYELGHDKNFTQGRPTSHVIAAALYITCRLEKTPHLLIDFSDILQINLYVLGACYLKFVKYLHLDLPLVDPSLFIHRFCAKLEFGDKTHLVSITALRLLQRMKRDWMTYGRRPNSLCGAAILIAARYHGFKRTTSQIVSTVHVCDETIRKRLEEFKKTTVASLTREEFEKIDLENDIKGELDPPSFKRALESKDYEKITNYEKELRREAELIESHLFHEEDESEGSEENDEKEGKEGKEKSNTSPVKGSKELALIEEEKEDEKQIVPVKPYSAPINIENYSETLSDIDDNEIQQFILTPEESSLKSILWHHIHKDWIEEQMLKKDLNAERKGPIKTRKRTVRQTINAPDVLSAVSQSTKLGNKVNQDVFKSIIEGHLMKKIKKE